MEIEEKIIIQTSGGWKASLGSSIATPLILTNKRLIADYLDISIPLKEITNVDIETKTVEAPKLLIHHGKKIDKIHFGRPTAGSLFHTLLGSVDKVAAETASYTSIWASLITMAKFLYGNPQLLEKEEKDFE